MATQNLVALYLDKTSGDIVATKRNNSGNSGNVKGFEHIQATPLLTWFIVHNANTKRLICQIYDENDLLLFADEVQLLDEDSIIVTFGAEQAGSAKIVFF